LTRGYGVYVQKLGWAVVEGYIIKATVYGDWLRVHLRLIKQEAAMLIEPDDPRLNSPPLMENWLTKEITPEIHPLTEGDVRRLGAPGRYLCAFEPEQIRLVLDFMPEILLYFGVILATYERIMTESMPDHRRLNTQQYKLLESKVRNADVLNVIRERRSDDELEAHMIPIDKHVTRVKSDLQSLLYQLQDPGSEYPGLRAVGTLKREVQLLCNFYERLAKEITAAMTNHDRQQLGAA
jgi:hypothetical protein